MPTPHDPLACALNEFKEQLTAKEKNELVCSPKPTELSVLELTRQIDETESRRGFRKMSWRFSNFIQCIHQFTSVVDTFVSSKPETAALVWGSVKFAIVVSMNPRIFP